MSDVNETLKVLKEARKVLAENRWIRGSLGYLDGDGEQCYCAYGAIAKAVGAPQNEQGYFDWGSFWRDFSDEITFLFETELAARELAYEIYRELKIPYNSSTIWQYNDGYAMSKEEVLEMFDSAIARLEAGL